MMMVRRKQGLGERHKKIIEFLNTFQGKNGYSPSIRQIGENIGVNSTSLVDYYLNQLEEMNLIERDQHVSRSIRLVYPDEQSLAEKFNRSVQKTIETASDLVRLPLRGRIFASEPIPVPATDLDYFDPESSVEVARSMLPGREDASKLYALEVQGDSMVDANVQHGDIVVMKKAEEATNGEMVAVWLTDTNETTLKYFYKENNRIRLQPANPTMSPIYINNPKHLRIQGKVVMVIRQVHQLAA
jgi:repressor LexA